MTVAYPWLGKPGAMQQLPAPRDVVTLDATRGEAVHELASGGTAVARRLNAKRTFELPYPALSDDEVDLITAFHEGLFGVGPYVFVDPSTRNKLPLDVSSCGVRTTAPHGWVASVGTLARTGTPPTDTPRSGVLQWSGSLASNASLEPGSVANVADTTTAPVLLPNQWVTVSLYVKAASAQPMALHAYQCGSNGAVVATTSTSFTSSTSWQRVTTSLQFNGAALYVIPRLVLGATVPTSVSIAAAQVEYAQTVSAWQRGYGSPRVEITAGPGRSVEVLGRHNVTLKLAEV